MNLFFSVKSKQSLPIRILYQSGVSHTMLEELNRKFAFSLGQMLQQNGLAAGTPAINTKLAILRGAKIPALLLELDNINAIDKNVKPEFIHKLAQAIDQSFED